ncbi:hypothetical protein KIH74_26410 [Kineosporia sp. J2-2]|uniref:TIGR02678 family protein n=1 Tax=Kineosporia corallincola TaxID=2835133 RepID=A0ABS5TN26_9ACTN|nr:hypothetical protein [Kineosporia corallincola]MBT0772507.1 hypothetical protein [Kineosporia corallincola]
MTDGPTTLSLEDLAPEAGVLRIYRQVFAVLAREHGAMIGDVDLLDIDEAILGAFADAGNEGLTLETAVAACRRYDTATVQRRFEVLRGYGAITRVVDHPGERFHRAAFAPYVMLLFLRRLASAGGQGELHQLLALEGMSIRAAGATADDGRGSVGRLTRVFRLMANQLASLTTTSPVEELREHAELLWGNRALISQAEEVHAQALGRWPELDRDCAALRTALAAYADASESAAARLIEQAGSTRALGLLPVETWRSFARTADAETLAGVLDGQVFDAVAPWFSPQAMAFAVENAQTSGPVRMPPPRPTGDSDAPTDRPVSADSDLTEFTDQVLARRERVGVSALLDDADDWMEGRRILSMLVAAHHSPEVDAELTWADGFRVDPEAAVPWVSGGMFGRTARPQGTPAAAAEAGA